MPTAIKLRILLVEDDGSIAQIIEIGLRGLGRPYELDHAFSAEEGMGLWQQQPYDLLLTDYNLRGKNGLELVQHLRESGSHVPVLMFTAYDSPQLRRDARAADIRFITKPFFVDQFVDHARSLLPQES